MAFAISSAMGRFWARLLATGMALSLCCGWLYGYGLGLDEAPTPLPEEKIIPFDTGGWRLYNGEVTQKYGRAALSGNAVLPAAVFSDGVIEVDVYFDKRMPLENLRSFTGLSFRARDIANYEQFYLRPHKPNSPDALQYTPVFGQISGWQLYSGEGFTAAATIPYDRWFRVRLEVLGTRARVFIDNEPRPALTIPELKHGAEKGFVGLMGATPGVAYFSNFKMDQSIRPDFPPIEPPQTPDGIITAWLLSKPLYAADFNRDHYPEPTALMNMEWRPITAERGGLADVARVLPSIPPITEPLAVFAKTIISAKSREVKKLRFGYSDAITVFLNGKTLFRGNSAFRSRDPLFLGVIGWEDSIFLPLEAGDNELMLMATESGFGWGFQCRLESPAGDAVVLFDGYKKVWETPRLFQVPESIVYDQKRDMFYVSNFTRFAPPGTEADNFISRLRGDGTIDNQKWISGLNAPTGMAIYKDKLFVAERRKLVEIDIPQAKITKKHIPEGALFLNDVAADDNGDVYVSDSQAHVIFRFHKGVSQVWLKDEAIVSPNGLWLEGKTLLIGSSGRGKLLKVSLKDKKITVLTDFGGETAIDGVQALGGGRYLCSDWGNRLIYHVHESGKRQVLADFSGAGVNPADFIFVAAKGLLVTPVFYGNRIMAFSSPEFIID